MKELSDLISNYDDQIYYSLEPFTHAFGLENGEEQLILSFEDVQMIRYEDSLEVTEAKPLVNYVLSFGRTNESLKGQKREDFKIYIDDILKKEGKIKITKNTGIFIAKNPK